MLVAPACLWLACAVGAPVDLAWSGGRLTLDETGRLQALVADDGTAYGVPGGAFCRVTAGGQTLEPVSVSRQGDRLEFTFVGGGKLTYQLVSGEGFWLVKLTAVSGFGATGPDLIEHGRLNVDGLPTVGGTIGAAYSDRYAVALMPAAMEVQPVAVHRSAGGANHQQVTHTFAPVTDDVKHAQTAAEFTAESKRPTGDGWSFRGRGFSKPLDLTGLRAIRVWVKGDGGGEQLKIQLHDGAGGYRDDYIPITFTGWREVTCDQPSLNTLKPGQVTQLGFYYNSLPAGRKVTCRIDQVRAVLPGGEVLLESFEDPNSDLWDGRGVRLGVQTHRRYGHAGAAFGLMAGPRERFTRTIAAFEQRAGLPSPRFAGKWGKESEWARRSYLFITSCGAKDNPEIIRWAHRGGLPMVLICDGSWNGPAGHYPVNEHNYPGGLAGLQQATAELKAAGLRVGLHFLAPAVYGNDPYVTPKPDPRLFRRGDAVLAADLTADANDVPTTAAPAGYPDKDGGYEGDGTVLQIDDELIAYGVLRTTAPFGFGACQRGAFGTQATAHRAGAPVRHVLRSYGYFLYDLDTTLADEVTGAVTKVANAIGADMLYMDGSERLQGDHWYYNAKLQRKYYEKLTNPNTLMQGSSHSSYSWHFTTRYASADGHGDVKGYLDERLPFKWYFDNLMPVDCGWYYVYDPQVTSDQYDYILQKCLGYNATISVQTSPHHLRTHPEMGTIFDLVNLYERLRLSGLVPAETLAKLRVPKREYRTLTNPLRLRRIAYGEWQTVAPGTTAPIETIQPAGPGARLGLEVRCGTRTGAGPSYTAPQSVALESFEDLSAFLGGDKTADVFVLGPGKAGSVKQGCTQRLESVEGGRDGRRCGRYTATSTLKDNSGYSAIGRAYQPALNLSAAQYIGLWLKGDGQGGLFKLQLRDAAGTAADYYVKNDFTDWRFVQLHDPQVTGAPTFDWSRLSHLLLYYNALPAEKTITMLVDGIRAIPAMDPAELSGFGFEAGGQRQMINARLLENERYIGIPGGPAQIVPATLGERRNLPPTTGSALAAPTAVRFVAEAAAAVAQVRWVQDLPEELPLPEAALKTPLPPLP